MRSVVLPALSVAVQRTVWAPAEDVETPAQLCDATPAPPSVAFGVAAAVAPRYVGIGLIVGASAGPVVSTSQANCAGVSSPWPARSIARTVKVWLPSAS